MVGFVALQMPRYAMRSQTTEDSTREHSPCVIPGCSFRFVIAVGAWKRQDNAHDEPLVVSSFPVTHGPLWQRDDERFLGYQESCGLLSLLPISATSALQLFGQPLQRAEAWHKKI
jgi:hypothetical protein